MSDDNLKGIGEDEKLRQDTDLEGIDAPDSDIAASVGELLEGISIRPEEQDIDPLQNILRGLPEAPQVDPEQLILEAQLARLTQLTEQNIILSQQRALLEQQRIEARSAETTSSGRDNAAELRLGQFRKDFDIYYDLNSGGDDLVVEVSLDGNTWRPFETVAIPGAGEEDIAQGSTTYTWVRVYVDNAISDSDVNLVELVARGD
jgi:hypothetical protein